MASVRKYGAGVFIMALALTASAKDGPSAGGGRLPLLKAGSAPLSRPVAQPMSQPVAHPGHSRKHWLEVGVASWYGAQFQGRKTAGGERFDMNLMTCAHPSLPMGTWLRVTNLKNRRTAFVRVNDRGPVIDDRIVDLSFAAAQAVGLVGIGRVKLEAVPQGDPELARALVAQVQIPVLFEPSVP